MNTAGADAAAARAAGPYSQRPRARLSLSRAPDRNSRNPPTKSSSTSRRDVRECPWRGPSHDGGGACRKVRVASCRSHAAKEQTKNKNGEENNNNFARANVPTQVIILPRGRGVSESASDGSMQGDVALQLLVFPCKTTKVVLRSVSRCPRWGTHRGAPHDGGGTRRSPRGRGAPATARRQKVQSHEPERWGAVE